MRTGGECWGCSAWRREGTAQTFFWPFSALRGLISKMGTGFLAGPVAIGQGVMASS